MRLAIAVPKSGPERPTTRARLKRDWPSLTQLDGKPLQCSKSISRDRANFLSRGGFFLSAIAPTEARVWVPNWVVSQFEISHLARSGFEPCQEPFTISDKRRLCFQEDSQHLFCLGAVMTIAFEFSDDFARLRDVKLAERHTLFGFR